MNGLAMYSESTTAPRSMDEIIKRHTSLVKRIAYHLIARLPHTVDVDDLIQTGLMGLMDAAQNYDANQGASFETYAGIRIRGSMLDEIRRNDWAPRSVHRKAREISAAIQSIEQEKGRNASDTEIAAALGLSIKEYNQQLHESTGHHVFSLDEFNNGDEVNAHPISEVASGPVESLQSNGFKDALANAIKTLPDRERLLMGLYYNEELNLKEIGEVLNVSESRVSQIHSQTVIRLRSKLGDWFN
ncbi:MAG: RNA polymerase sigma factor FliA [Methylophaga sp.]|nr:MAG: RNA polymerase sigma factor FliA [Methylophaga sp.]